MAVANAHKVHTHCWKSDCNGNSCNQKPGLKAKVGQDYEYH